MSGFIHICVLAKDPSKPLAVSSAEVGKEMFRGSKYGPDVTFQKEIGLGYWSVWSKGSKVGWINMSRIVNEDFIEATEKKPRRRKA